MKNQNNKIARRRFIRGLTFVPLIGYFPNVLNLAKGPDETEKDHSWISSMQEEHPRLFFNKTTFLGVRSRALNEEKEIFQEMKDRIDLLLGKKIEFRDPLIQDGTANDDHEYGTRACEAALVYRILQEGKYLDLCKELLVTMRDYYNLRLEHKLNIHWYAWSTINCLASFDWVYNDLTKKERFEIGGPLLSAMNKMSSTEGREKFYRENTGGITTGFYGPPCLSWYAGVVFYKTGIDDSLAKKLLLKGYDDYISLLDYRRNISGEDGGAASGELGYCMGAYPWAEFGFFHSFTSTTGIDIGKDWPYIPDFLRYIFWNWIPGDREFGYGDTRHFTNAIPLGEMHIHLSNMIHFYGKTQPDKISLAKWMLTKVKKQKREVYPFVRFLLSNTHEEILAKGPSESTPLARHFKNMGQLFMRSGSGPDDTYALFTAGGILRQHRHYDNNNFIIYKKGFLALDTGTRPQPGLHLTHYYCRTVAHNCVLINMPGETMPRYWGVVGTPAPNETLVPVPNDGGQNEILGSEIIAFDENPHYVYISSDATKSYHPDKAKLVIRHFVFLPPDHFVILDQVISAKPEYKKSWLLHTAKEPVIKSDSFYADQENGRLFCKTLLPEKTILTKIGGPGKQFWSGDRNWPLPVTNRERNFNQSEIGELLGQWRMEITPENNNKEDVFLHLIQVGDQSLAAMTESRLIKSGDMTGLSFNYRQREYEVIFNTKDKTGGRISVKQNGTILINENFSIQIKSQKGLF
jgi:hypothetical protein